MIMFPVKVISHAMRNEILSRNWLKLLKFRKTKFIIAIQFWFHLQKIIAATHKKSALSRSHNGIFPENQHISL